MEKHAGRPGPDKRGNLFFLLAPINDLMGVMAVVFALAGLCLLGLPALAAQKTPPAGQVQAQARQQVEVRRGTQKLVDEFAQKQRRLADRLEAVQVDLKAVRKQREKTDAYVKDMQGRVSELKRRVHELERLGREMEPFLDSSTKKLRELVAKDLPFLPRERQKRLDDLERTLNRYGEPVTTKLRALLSALEIEARYGSTAGTWEAELELGGSRKLARLFRLGRLALFALSPDGLRAWRYDRSGGGFLPLGDYQAEIARAADIAARKRVVELVELPVGQPQAASGEKRPQP